MLSGDGHKLEKKSAISSIFSNKRTNLLTSLKSSGVKCGTVTNKESCPNSLNLVKVWCLISFTTFCFDFLIRFLVFRLKFNIPPIFPIRIRRLTFGPQTYEMMAISNLVKIKNSNFPCSIFRVQEKEDARQSLSPHPLLLDHQQHHQHHQHH